MQHPISCRCVCKAWLLVSTRFAMSPYVGKTFVHRAFGLLSNSFISIAKHVQCFLRPRAQYIYQRLVPMTLGVPCCVQVVSRDTTQHAIPTTPVAPRWSSIPCALKTRWPPSGGARAALTEAYGQRRRCTVAVPDDAGSV